MQIDTIIRNQLIEYYVYREMSIQAFLSLCKHHSEIMIIKQDDVQNQGVKIHVNTVNINNLNNVNVN